jgi:cell division protein FtsB
MLKNAIVLFIFAVVVFLLYLPSYTQMQDLRQKNSDYKVEIQQLKLNNKKLLTEKKRLEEDPAYFEKVAREKMGLIKEGEMVFKIVPANKIK